MRLERPAEAEPLLRSLAADRTASQGAYAALELATLELERNRPAEAMKTLELGLKQFPRSQLLPALNFRAAEVLEQQNQLDAAQARFERIAGSAPMIRGPTMRIERAIRLAFARGDLAGARRLAGTFARQFPQSRLGSDVRLIEARAAAQQGKHDEAVAILKSLVAPPGDADKKAAAAIPPALMQAARYELALCLTGPSDSPRLPIRFSPVWPAREVARSPRTLSS